MAEIPVAITFPVAPEVVAEIAAVDPRIRILDFPAAALRAGAELPSDEKARALATIAEAEVAFGPARIPPEYLRAATNLKWFQCIVAGADALVKEGLVGQHFVVTNSSGLSAVNIAEYCVASMLIWSKRLDLAVRQQMEHRWQGRQTGEIMGKTVGIAGMGAIGRELARRSRAFGMRVIASRRTIQPGDTDPDCDLLLPHGELDTLLRESDYLVLCVPLTPETHHLIGAAELARMKPGACLINIARGPVVDQAALIAALKAETIAGAILDVTDPEPLPADDPLWDAPNVVITPHVSGSVEGYGHRAAEIFLANLRRYCAGEPLENVVDPVLGY